MALNFSSSILPVPKVSTKIETGFAKLEQAMKFKKVTSVASHKLNFSQFMPMVTRLVPAVAAALIIALVLPIGLSRAFNTNSNSNELNEVAYISHILEPKNSLNVKDVLSNEQVSLIKTTENLKNVDLENIVTGNSSSNIYASVEDIINSSSSNFSNVYKSDKNLYNVAYSPFVGF